MGDVENVIIIGSGPAGYTAALYTARANLHPLVVEGFAWGGLLQQTTDVENYPGFPDGMMGPEMMQKFRDQAERFGARLITDQAERVELAERARGRAPRVGRRHRAPGAHRSCWRWAPSTRSSASPASRSCPVAASATAPPVTPRSSATRTTVIVGGGDSAMEEAIFLSKFASKVTVVNRRDEFRASKIMLERARAQANIELLTPYIVKEFVAGENGALGHATLSNVETGEERRATDLGRVHRDRPRAAVRARARADRVDENGYVVTDGHSTRTNRPGVFAAGDLVDHTYRQAITAAGSGCQAALDAEWYLRDTPGIPVPEGMPMGDPAEAQYAPAASDAAS